MFKNKNAFTLVELLVAMFIFSVMAVLLVPNVTQSAEKNLFITQLKKVNNDIQQGLLLMIAKNNGSLMGICSGVNSNQCFIDELVGSTQSDNSPNTTYMAGGYLEKRVSYGANVNKSDCNYDSELKDPCRQSEAYIAREPQYMNKANVGFVVHKEDSFYASNLTNGATISAVFNSLCNSSFIDGKLTTKPAGLCGYMEVDLNGSKVPNMVGKDIHYFWIDPKDGLIPFGEIDDFECINIKTDKSEDQGQLGCTDEIIQKGKIEHY